MDLTHVLRGPAEQVRLAVVGASGQYARTLLGQPHPQVRATVLCDVDLDTLEAVATALRLPSPTRCTSTEQVRATCAAGGTAIVGDTALLDADSYDVLVEATGNVAVGVRVARAALEAGRHVAMASKETESIAGRYLADVAAAHGVVHTTVDGDQPGNLVELVTWAHSLGLRIVAAGKSSEYDVVLDHATGRASHPSGEIDVPELVDAWTLGDDVRATLDRRRELLAPLTLAAAADHCEMAVVANAAGLVPDVPRMHLPVARIPELADVYAEREQGGLVGRTPAVDVFTHLRRPDEASFAGGVFVVVRCEDERSWEVLAAKGHVVSADRRYACLYRPYHLMGVETLLTVLHAARNRAPAGVSTGAAVVMAARAARPVPAGERFEVRGHHHEIDGLEPVLLPYADAPDAAPYYLAGGATLTHALEVGDVLRLDALTGVDDVSLDAWRASAPSSSSSDPAPER